MKVRFNKKHLNRKHTGKAIVSALKTLHSKQETTIIPTEDIYIAGEGLQNLIVIARIEINVYDNTYLIIRAEDINLEKEYTEVELKLLYINKAFSEGTANLITLLTDYGSELQRNILTVLGNFTDTLASYEEVPL